MPSIRLQRYLARCSLGSRRACERLISQGRISINGEVVTEMGTRVEDNDIVRFDGNVVKPARLRYFILNKPKGAISVNSDHKGRQYVVDLVPEGRVQGLFPVGRLDLDTSGLLILTNDGDLANRIAHPRFQVKKEYITLVKGKWTLDELRKKTSEGVRIDDGSLVKDIEILKVEPASERTMVTLRIHEGRKHVVKRIFLSLESRVYELHRSSIGALTLGDLKEGEFMEVEKSFIEKRI